MAYARHTLNEFSASYVYNVAEDIESAIDGVPPEFGRTLLNDDYGKLTFETHEPNSIIATID